MPDLTLNQFLANMEAIANLYRQLEGHEINISWPEQNKLAGSIKYPGYAPQPLIKEIFLTEPGGTKFGESVVEFSGQYKVDVDQPIYLQRITASLEKVMGREGLGYYRPLSSNGIEVPSAAEDLCDFRWRINPDSEDKLFCADWIDSCCLESESDEGRGYLLPCQYEAKKGETLIIKAIPLRAVPQGDGYNLVFRLHFVKYVVDQQKLAKALG